MSYLICYSKNAPIDHAIDKAIYLDQAFYELVFNQCRATDSTYPVLGQMAQLSYKSPIITIMGERLSQLKEELQKFNKNVSHPQTNHFRKVCETAIERGSALTISGDMYPELQS